MPNVVKLDILQGIKVAADETTDTLIYANLWIWRNGTGQIDIAYNRFDKATRNIIERKALSLPSHDYFTACVIARRVVNVFEKQARAYSDARYTKAITEAHEIIAKYKKVTDATV
jgi:hypothetical protein